LLHKHGNKLKVWHFHSVDRSSVSRSMKTHLWLIRIILLLIWHLCGIVSF
jgi:hypothetical protein